MKGRDFPSQNQVHMIYKDLHESYSLLRERTKYFTRGDQCFGHLPDFIRCLADEDVCRILSNCVFRSFYKTPMQQNVISSLGRKPIT